MNFEIHADYNRDGTLTTTSRDYQLRQRAPGAIILPNFDADGRRLPRAMSPGPDIQMDVERQTKASHDNDLTPILIKATSPAALQNADCFIRISGQRAEQIKVYDSRGNELRSRTIPAAASFFREFNLVFSANPLRLKVEAGIFPGSPTNSRNLGHYTMGSPMRLNENLIKIEVFGPAANGGYQLEDWGFFSIAPLLFPDNSAPAKRLYICELPENGSAVEDVQRILRQIPNVSFVKVPENMSLGDAWMQDQYQVGYTQGPRNSMNVLLHLPRLRSNIIQSALVENLATMVTAHFPSSGVGVIQAFWQRQVRALDTTGRRHSVPFKDTFALLTKMGAVYNIRRFMAEEIRSRSSSAIPDAGDFSAVVRGLQGILRSLTTILDREISSATQAEDRDMLRALKHTFQNRVRDMLTPFQVSSTSIQLHLSPQITARFPHAEADRLFTKLHELHSGANYGGNIEVFPATANAPLGKLVIGNVSFMDGSNLMDSDLLHFLRAQGKQPIVQFDVTWLDVGHIDEILTFVKNRNNQPAICRASPGIAIRILNEAIRTYRDGLSEYHESSYRPSGILDRKMDDGTSPVTQMLRGKLWLHHHPPRSLEELNPPWIYRNLAKSNARWQGHSIHEIPYVPGEGQDRHYFANISPFEFLYHERDKHHNSVNQFIETEFMGALDRNLAHEFDDTKVYQLPVLFDAISDLNSWRENKREAKTSAFTPNVVNMQHINGHVLIPRPYGPRMKATDALTVLRKVCTDTGQSEMMRGISLRWFQRKGLNRTIFWVKKQAATIIYNPSGTIPSDGSFGRMESVTHIAKKFKDGFPENTVEEVVTLIRDANRGLFHANGNIKSGWREITIPENTIDLFEAYTQIVMEHLGQHVHWVDSWFYHVRLGEIHCGTNVIRKPTLTRQNAWWNVQYREQMDFEEEVINVR